MSGNVLTMYNGPRRVRGPGQAKVAAMVSFSDGSGPGPSAAYVERELPPGGISAYLAARRGGTRSFAVWADDQRRERVATLVTLSTGGGVAWFQVWCALQRRKPMFRDSAPWNGARCLIGGHPRPRRQSLRPALLAGTGNRRSRRSAPGTGGGPAFCSGSRSP